MEFTHNYELKFNSIVISGECEFNADGIASYNTDENLPGLTTPQMSSLNEIMNEVQKAFVAFGGLDKIEIVSK